MNLQIKTGTIYLTCLWITRRLYSKYMKSCSRIELNRTLELVWASRWWNPAVIKYMDRMLLEPSAEETQNQVDPSATLWTPTQLQCKTRICSTTWFHIKIHIRVIWSNLPTSRSNRPTCQTSWVQTNVTRIPTGDKEQAAAKLYLKELGCREMRLRQMGKGDLVLGRELMESTLVCRLAT